MNLKQLKEQGLALITDQDALVKDARPWPEKQAEYDKRDKDIKAVMAMAKGLMAVSGDPVLIAAANGDPHADSRAPSGGRSLKGVQAGIAALGFTPALAPQLEDLDAKQLEELHQAAVDHKAAVVTTKVASSAEVPQAGVPTFQTLPVSMRREPTRVLSLVPTYATDSPVVVWYTTTGTTAAAAVAEGATKPTSTLAYTSRTGTVTNASVAGASKFAGLGGRAGHRSADEDAAGVEQNLGGLAADGFDAGLEFAGAQSLIDAQLGTLQDRSAQAGEVAGKLYRDGLFESMGDAGEAVRAVSQNIGSVGELGADAFEQTTAQAKALAAALGEEVAPVTSAISSMLQSGLAPNAEAAMDILTAGMQEGVNKGEDLADTFKEYSVVFKQLGLDGRDTIGLLTQGLEGGAFNADFIADAMKEFTIKAQEAMVEPVDPAAVQAAQQAVADAYESMADSVESAQARVKAANESAAAVVSRAETDLGAAQRDALTAQEALTQARADARQGLADLADQLASASLGEEGAQLALERAQVRLSEINQDGASSPLDIREALYAVDKAKAALDDQQQKVRDIKKEKAEADRAGIRGSEEVKAAQVGVRSANADVTAAVRALAAAQKDQTQVAREGAAEVAAAQQAGAQAIADAQAALAQASTPQLTAMGLAYQQIGLDGEAVGQAVARGGDSARKAFASALDGLRSIEDPTTRAQLAVSLFGTKAEDLQGAFYNMDLDTAADGMGAFTGRIKEANQAINTGTAVDMQAMENKLTELKAKMLDLPGADLFLVYSPAIGAVTSVMGPMIASLVALRVGQAAGAAATAGATGANIGFAASMWAAAAPILGVVAAIALVVGGAWLIIKHWDKVSGFFGDMWRAVKVVTGAAAEWIGGKFTDLLGWFQDLPARLGGAVSGLGRIITAPFRAAWGYVSDVYDLMISGVGNVYDWVSNKVGAALDFFFGIPGKLAELPLAIGNSLKNGLHAILEGIAWLWNNTIGAIGFTVPDWIPGIGGKSFSVPDIEIPALAAGGVALGPTLALIGEAGREAVVPLDRAEEFGFGGGSGMATVIVQVDGRELVRAIARRESIDAF